MLRGVLIGMMAGSAGTVALNVTTNLDMVVRGRPASNVPAIVAGKLAGLAGIEPLSSDPDEEKLQNRQSGAGALLGLITGLGVGAIYGLIRPRISDVPTPAAGVGLGLAAMAASDVPIAALGVSDPRTWRLPDWLSDLIPHLIYGFVTAAVYEFLSGW